MQAQESEFLWAIFGKQMEVEDEMDFSGVSSYALPWRTSVWVYAIFSRHTFFKGLQQQRDAGDESFRGATFFSVPLLLGKRNHTLMGSFTFKNQGGLFLLYISGKV